LRDEFLLAEKERARQEALDQRWNPASMAVHQRRGDELRGHILKQMMYVNAAEFFPTHGQQREVWFSLSPPPTTNSHIVLDGRDAQLFDE
jgi:hypothetical protein